MATKVRTVSRKELTRRRARILRAIGLTDSELKAKVATGGLVGSEWAAWSDIEDIDFLLGRD